MDRAWSDGSVDDDDQFGAQNVECAISRLVRAKGYTDAREACTVGNVPTEILTLPWCDPVSKALGSSGTLRIKAPVN
jgi:hypothetical protein